MLSCLSQFGHVDSIGASFLDASRSGGCSGAVVSGSAVVFHAPIKGHGGTSLGSPAPATTQPRRCSRRPVRWRHRPLARVRPCRPGSRCGAGHGGTRRSRRNTAGGRSSRGLLVVSIPIRSQRVLLAIGRLVVEARQVREAIGEFLRHLIARQSGFNRYEHPTTSEVLGDPSIAVPVALLRHHISPSSNRGAPPGHCWFFIHCQHSDRPNSPIAASSSPVMIDPYP